jgi:hypothetical protein
MDRRRVSLLLLATTLVAGVGCRPESLDLSYRFAAGEVLRYRMHAVATAEWDIGQPGKGGYEITYDVVEAVQSVDEEGAEVAVAMSPVEVTSEGLPAPGPEDRTFTLVVGTGGEVRQILEVDGVSAQDLDPNDLAFIGTYRPPLPLERVALGDSWTSEQQVDLGSVFQQLENLGTLSTLDLEGAARIATLEYEGDGPLRWTTTLPQGDASLEGLATTSSTARFDVLDGSLRGAVSETVGDFDVNVVGSGGAPPVVGSLHLELDLELERL